MFTEFLKAMGETNIKSYSSVEEFLGDYNGKSFKDGLYTFLKTEDVEKWNEIVWECFPLIKGRVDMFAYDWLASMYGIDREDGQVVLIEPGAHALLGAPYDFVGFHNELIVDDMNQALSSDFFDSWMDKNNCDEIPAGKCVGYKKPLFLGGEDVVENLELSDLEVYWSVIGALNAAI